jgi:hypothetical protein
MKKDYCEHQLDTRVKLVYIWFFWYQCDKCKHLFKREYMWRVKSPFPSLYRPRFFCRECAKVREQALNLAE